MVTSNKLYDTTVYPNKAVAVSTDLLTLGDSGNVIGGVNQNATMTMSALAAFVAANAITLAGVAGNFTATAPAQTANAQPGVGVTITASNAVDGSSGHAAQVGGSITLTSGQGINTGNDGNIALVSGGGVHNGFFTVAKSGQNPNLSISMSPGGNFQMGSNCYFGFTSTTNASGTIDTFFQRISAGVFGLGDGSYAPGITIPNASSGAGKTFTLTGSSAASGSGGAGGNLNFQVGAGDGAGADGQQRLLSSTGTHYAYFSVRASDGFTLLSTDNNNGFRLGTNGSGNLDVSSNIAFLSGSLWGRNAGCSVYLPSGGQVGFGSNAGDNTGTNDTYFTRSSANVVGVNNSLAMVGTVTRYNNVSTAGTGVPAIYGLDSRTGLTGADGAATTLYTSTAANQIYRVSADIFATAAVTGTATYTITWTENATTQTMTVTATAINTLGTQSNIIRPDNATAITAQLTGTFTGTFTVVGLVERVA